MKFSSQIWSAIFFLYKFKYMSKIDIKLLAYERNSNIPKIFLKFKRFRLHNGQKFRYINLNKYKVGLRFGYYLLTRSLTKLKKKKKKRKDGSKRKIFISKSRIR